MYTDNTMYGLKAVAAGGGTRVERTKSGKAYCSSRTEIQECMRGVFKTQDCCGSNVNRSTVLVVMRKVKFDFRGHVRGPPDKTPESLVHMFTLTSRSTNNREAEDAASRPTTDATHSAVATGGPPTACDQPVYGGEAGGSGV